MKGRCLDCALEQATPRSFDIIIASYKNFLIIANFSIEKCYARMEVHFFSTFKLMMAQLRIYGYQNKLFWSFGYDTKRARELKDTKDDLKYFVFMNTYCITYLQKQAPVVHK